MGGLVSFELARFLRANYNLQPSRLFISGRRPPQIPGTAAPIHSLPLPEFIAQLRRLKGTPKAVLKNTELRQILVPILRVDFAVTDVQGRSFLFALCLGFTIAKPKQTTTNTGN